MDRHESTRPSFRLKVTGHREKPQLMALSTDDDEPVDWLRAGQALQRAVLTGTWYSVSAPYGRAARYHAPPRYGVPARHHLLKQDELAPYGLSASPVTHSLEWADIRGEARRWPWRWRYPDLPQMIAAGWDMPLSQQRATCRRRRRWARRCHNRPGSHHRRPWPAQILLSHDRSGRSGPPQAELTPGLFRLGRLADRLGGLAGSRARRARRARRGESTRRIASGQMLA